MRELLWVLLLFMVRIRKQGNLGWGDRCPYWYPETQDRFLLVSRYGRLYPEREASSRAWELLSSLLIMSVTCASSPGAFSLPLPPSFAASSTVVLLGSLTRMVQSKRRWLMDNEIMLSFWGRRMQRHIHSLGRGCWDAVGARGVSSFDIYQHENTNCLLKMWIRQASARSPSPMRWRQNELHAQQMRTEPWEIKNSNAKSFFPPPPQGSN